VAILAALDRLAAVPIETLLESRYRRYREMGPFATVVEEPSVPPERPGLADRLRHLIDAGRHTIGSPGAGIRGRDEPPARDEV
jgi:hypothetical protein